jgi:hypothetical protein
MNHDNGEAIHKKRNPSLSINIKGLLHKSERKIP